MIGKDEIAARLDTLIDDRDVSGKQLASYLGVAQSTLSNWRTGKNAIDTVTLTRICEYMHITMDEFFGNKSELPAGEKYLLQLWRKADDQAQGMVMAALLSAVKK